MSLLRFLMLLALIVWIGGIIFFAFVLAPSVFHVLPTTRMAGDVVNATLGKLHCMGLISGVVFLACSLLYSQRKHARWRVFALSHVFVALMLGFTMISQFGITPRMVVLRSQLQMVQAPGYQPYVAGTTPELIELYSRQFNQLHEWSTRLEGGVLLLGLGVVILTARRFGNS